MKRTGPRGEKTAALKEINKLKIQADKVLKEGEAKLIKLERRIAGGKKFAGLQTEARGLKKNLKAARGILDTYEKKAEHYVVKNPKKALAMATAVGVLLGKRLSTYEKKKGLLRNKR